MGDEAKALPRTPSRTVGRYSLHTPIARGGMATIYVGTLMGPVGFSRTVAIKRLHEGFAQDPDFVAMLLDEARLAGRILHPNVVSIVDVVAEQGEVFLVMDYVAGEAVGTIARSIAEKNGLVPLRILSAILTGALSGLHAAHEAKSDRGEPLLIVHRDMSPQNILLGADGVPRVIDFGVAKAAARIQVTQDGQVKGKLRYMAPEQVLGGEVTRAADIYAVGVMLWELATGLKLREGESTAQIALSIISDEIPDPMEAMRARGVSFDEQHEKYLPEIGRVVRRATAMAPENRYESAKEMARDLAESVPVATTAEIADWLESVAGPSLAERAALVAEVEREVADASGEARPSQVMRALAASRPDPIEIALGTPSGIARFTPTVPPPQVSTVPAPEVPKDTSGGPNASHKTAILVAIFLCLGAFFLWLSRGEPHGPTIDAAVPLPPLTGVISPMASSSATLSADASTSATGTSAPSAAPPPTSKGPPPPPTPCQPFTYDEQGVKRYNPKCLQ